MKSTNAILSVSMILFSVAISAMAQTAAPKFPALAASAAGKAAASAAEPSAPEVSEPVILDQGAARNPLKIAQLKWYVANSHTQFSVGSQPYGMCFDGENIWVANNADNTVSKVRANDGSTQGTFSVPAGPMGLAFDGANIWVTSTLQNNVTKLRDSDGKILGSYPTGKYPFWPAFDGQNIWTPNGPDNYGQQDSRQRREESRHIYSWHVSDRDCL